MQVCVNSEIWPCFAILLKQALSSEDRKNILLDIANALEANEKTIKAENDLDVAAAQQAGYEESLVARLVMKPGKVKTVIHCVIKSMAPVIYIVCFLCLIDLKPCSFHSPASWNGWSNRPCFSKNWGNLRTITSILKLGFKYMAWVLDNFLCNRLQMVLF